MNVTLGSGKAVHLEGRAFTPACGRGSGLHRTDAAVTCKSCLKVLAAREEASARTAYMADLADQQDMDLSQAESTVASEGGRWMPVDETPAEQPTGRMQVAQPPRAAVPAVALAEDRHPLDAALIRSVCCDCGAAPDYKLYENYKGQLFCAPCANGETDAAPEPVETDPRTGLPIVTVYEVRYVVGLWQRTSYGNVDYVDFWLAGESTGFQQVWRAYADATPGTAQRGVWDAQRALR